MQKRLRMTNKQDFNKVYRFGKSTANRQFVLYFRENPSIEKFRLGISVSKKVGNAVVRNRMRRLLKEIVRQHEKDIVPLHDFIIIVRKPATLMTFNEMEKSVLHVLKRASLLLHKGRERKPS